MKRVMLDTNICGRMVIDDELDELRGLGLYDSSVKHTIIIWLIQNLAEDCPKHSLGG